MAKIMEITIPSETLTLQEYQGRLRALRRAQLGLASVDSLELEHLITRMANGSIQT